ncbi:hypothetical protein OIO90_005713 [Microbotryomycetes sp. JL221]|nr:hypothetical protein OIO90_005713 [Microbotryomycetes sp. JL221]
MSSTQAGDTAPPQASQHFVNAILGTVIVGWQVQLILYGFAIAKLSSYFHTKAYRTDPRWLKTLLHATVIACTAQSAISFYSIWHYSTWQQRDENTLYDQTLADCFATGPVGIVAVLVQGYLVYRASILFPNQLVRAIYLVFMGLCILVGLSGAIMYIACSFLYRANKPFPPGLDYSMAIGTWLWASAFVDLMITVSLAVVLRSRIMHFNASTDTLLRRLIKLAVQTASYTAILATCGAALAFSFSSDSENSIYTNAAGSFYQPLSSCYLISLLVTLSFRNKAAQEREQTRVPVISTGQLHGFANTNSLVTSPSRFEAETRDVQLGGTRVQDCVERDKRIIERCSSSSSEEFATREAAASGQRSHKDTAEEETFEHSSRNVIGVSSLDADGAADLAGAQRKDHPVGDKPTMV